MQSILYAVLFQLDIIVASRLADATTDSYTFQSDEAGITVEFLVYLPKESDTPTHHEILGRAICDSIEEGTFITENVTCDSLTIGSYPSGTFLLTKVKNPFHLLVNTKITDYLG